MEYSRYTTLVLFLLKKAAAGVGLGMIGRYTTLVLFLHNDYGIYLNSLGFLVAILL